MCSIAGYTGPRRPAMERAFHDLMRHRGPDAEGHAQAGDWMLLHQRLSIIDLSPAANQPMELHGNWLIFNGEIYNYKELRSVHLGDDTLKSSSDTEVLLHLLDRHGLAILNQLNGMFAFAWYNRQDSCLHLVRDRFGVKPIYWTATDTSFAFASEIKPLLLLQKNIEYDNDVLETYITASITDHDHRTFAKNIFQVPPGHHIRFRNDQAETTHWYRQADSNPDAARLCSFSEATDYFEELLVDAIRLRLRSDVPVAITLSGGLDSTTIYSLAKNRLQANLQPFTLVRPGFLQDESAFARRLAARFGDTLREVPVSAYPQWIAVMESIRALEFPVMNVSSAAFFEIYQAIQQAGCRVVLEGHGGDELLGGYPAHLNAAWITLLARGHPLDAFRIFKSLSSIYHPDFQPRQRRTPSWLRFLTEIKRDIRRHGKLFDYKRCRQGYFEQVLRDSFERTSLPMILRTFDRLPMACSLESRSPFMDYRIVELSRMLPLEYKINQDGTKTILRQILRRHGCDEVAQARWKMPFATNALAFLKDPVYRQRLSEAVEQLDERFAPARSNALRLLNKDFLLWSEGQNIWRAAAVPLTRQMYADWLSAVAGRIGSDDGP